MPLLYVDHILITLSLLNSVSAIIQPGGVPNTVPSQPPKAKAWP